MGIINLLTRKAPTFGTGDNSVEFDAVLEDTLRGSVEFTKFPLEMGARASDHGIIQPFEWSLTGSVSNNPLRPSVGDFAGGFLSNFFDSGIVAGAAGLSAGFLSGSSETRASSTLEFLFGLMIAREPFDIDAGDIQLVNMVITDIRRTKNKDNEGGLVFVASLQELPLVSTVIINNEPGTDELASGDPAKTQATATINKGEVTGQTPTAETTAQVQEVSS